MIRHASTFLWILIFFANSPACFAQELANERATDAIREMQFVDIDSDVPSFGYWGDNPTKYSSWTNHSNRLVPIYTFGIGLEKYTGENSVYRSAEALEKLYGQLPPETLNPKANYMDQSNVYQLQKDVFESGKKNVILIVFDGMDWQTAYAASIYKNKKVLYGKGRGTGLAFMDYDGCKTDFGAFVCSPHNKGTETDVDAQIVKNPGGGKRGGYSVQHGGGWPWSKPKSPSYLIGKLKSLDHVVTDSAASATSMTTGVKTYNAAIAVDHEGNQLIPIGQEMQQQGYKVGVVSSVPFSHATPASSYANNVNRNDYQDISRDMLGLKSISHKSKPLPGMDVVIGCGWGETKKDDRKKQGRNFVPGNKYIAATDAGALNVDGGGKYVVAERSRGKDGGRLLRRAAARAAKENHRLMGFFGAKGGHLPYQTADGCYDPTRGAKSADSYNVRDILENPTLEEMTRAALTVLGTGEKGFWLMIEAGDVDWANHNNNIDDSIGAVLSGESAFEAVTEWVENFSSWDDTAVIVTADHGHMLVINDPEALTGVGQQKKAKEVAAETNESK